MSDRTHDHLNLIVDEWVSIRLDWQTIVSLAVKATTHQYSFQDMMEHAMKDGLQYGHTPSYAHAFTASHASICTTMQTTIQAANSFTGLMHNKAA